MLSWANHFQSFPPTSSLTERLKSALCPLQRAQGAAMAWRHWPHRKPDSFRKNHALPVTNPAPRANNQIEPVVAPIIQWGTRNGNLVSPRRLTSSK